MSTTTGERPAPTLYDVREAAKRMTRAAKATDSDFAAAAADAETRRRNPPKTAR